MCLSNPFMHSSKHGSYRYKYFLIINICKSIFVFTCLPFLSMQYKLDYALKTQKWKAVRSYLAIYDRPFHTWWNTNYIAHVQKWKETKKTFASQTWPKQFDITLHSLPKLVRRIRLSEEWVRSNLVASKPKSLAIFLSQSYECRKRTSSISILGLEVQPCLSISSKACMVPTFVVATLNASSFSSTLT